jgi:phosphoenolpyruvate-protein kinase (PTS system EI component)
LADLARESGHLEEAEIMTASRLIAEDPVLRRDVEELAARVSAHDALLESTERYAVQLEELPDRDLAARAADVREVGRSSARLLTGAALPGLSSRPTVVVARDLGPADFLELRLGNDSIQGVALAVGSAVSHVAIMARALELPLVVGLGGDLLEVNDGDAIRLDGDRGELIIEAGGDLSLFSDVPRQESRQEPARGGTCSPLRTRDGRRVTLLCNAANTRDALEGLAGGAEGIGLLRTEFGFLRANSWPTHVEHEAFLRSTLVVPRGQVVTVRTLDFGHDKRPPFLADTTDRGLALTLSYPEALCEQLRAIVKVSTGSHLRVLFPHVKSVDEMRGAKLLLAGVVRAIDPSGAIPPVGAMIETWVAAAKADEIAAASDFLAIGTNDIVRYLLESDDLPCTNLEAVADPRVLEVVSSIVKAAHARGLPVEICGEAATVPLVLPLLIGLGIDEVSVAPARLALVRDIVQGLSASEASVAAHSALSAASVTESLAVAAALLGSTQGS